MKTVSSPLSKSPLMTASYLEEPTILFGNGNLHPDPKTGISAFGPASLNTPGKHPEVVNLGFVGTAKTVDGARRWVEACAGGVPGTSADLGFPGFSKDVGYFSRLATSDNWTEELTHVEVSEIEGIGSKKDRFDRCVELISSKLKLLASRDNQPTCVVVALPDQLLGLCRSVRYKVPKRGLATLSLRNVLKARVMKHGIPTQILLEDTIDQERDSDLLCKKAWNFFTGLYFKAGGVPWSPHALPAGTCYVGISFFRPSDDAPKVRTSVVQAFDENGESLILRGPDFEWDEAKQGASPHLDGQSAHGLLKQVLERYEGEVKRRPKRVVIHKTSAFEPAERDGFKEALKEGKIGRFDFVAMRPTSEVRLLRQGTRPALRGTRFSVGNTDYLYTTGYIDCLKLFPAMHVPSPLLITDHVGYDTARDALLWEILALTKMNWNSARFGGQWPITLKFSRAVAEILKELGDESPRPQFKFYR